MLGHVLGPASVGVYSLGSDLALMPTTEVIGPFARAAFSGFTAARNQGDQTAETFLRMVAGMMMLTLPAGFGLSLMADPLVALAFGRTWIDAVPVVQVMGVAGALTVFSYMGGTFLSAHAMLRTVLGISIAMATTRLLLLVLLLVVWPHGVLGSAYAVAVSVLLGDVLTVAAMRYRFGVSLTMLGQRLWRCFSATAVMTLVLVASGLGWHGEPGGAAVQTWHLLIGSLVGLASYTVVLLSFWALSGRPEGGEAQILRVLGSTFTRVGARLRRA
jgi:O-antigen/teichoic acid export membrane protein